MLIQVIQIIVLLAICGVAWYFAEPYVKTPFREMIIAVIVIAFCVWLLSVFGLFHLPGRI